MSKLAQQKLKNMESPANQEARKMSVMLKEQTITLVAKWKEQRQSYNAAVAEMIAIADEYLTLEKAKQQSQ